MKKYEVFRSRIWPQHFVGYVWAYNLDEAMTVARSMNVLNPIVGECK